jgi:muconolactone delta-isomerase
MMNSKLIASVALLIVLSVLSPALGKSKNKSTTEHAPSLDVAQQANDSQFIRRKNEPWEGDDDVEYTKSQEESMIAPVIAWTKKKKMWQVPVKYSENSNFTVDEKAAIAEQLAEVAWKLNVKFVDPTYETYVLTITSQCANNLLKKIPQPYNEVPICIEARLPVATEITRAVAIGSHINKRISYDDDDSDESDDE